MDLTHEYTYDIEHRFKYLAWAVAVVFLVIIGRLYYLQIIKGSYYRFFSEQNSIKDVKIPAIRGIIYDRNGRIIVDDRPAFDITVTPQYAVDRGKTIATLATILGIDATEISARLDKGKGLPSYYPIIVEEDSAMNHVSMVRAYKTPMYDLSDEFDMRGIDVQMRYARTYPGGLSISHLFGYLKEIDEEGLKKKELKYPGRYTAGDFIGIGGVEEVWDQELRGNDGYDQRVVNAVGREVAWPDIKLGHKEPQNGSALHLTIDEGLQTAAKEALKDKNGAVVALDPNTGEILALYSSPSFDLNKLSSSEGGKYWSSLSMDENHPLYDRTIQGTYPPASTFKVVTAAAALEEKEITPAEKIFCGGGLRFGDRFYQCWMDKGHGSISLVDALASSCDTFFYQLGLRLGVDKIAKYANLLRMGSKTGIDIPREKSGLIPTSEWKERTRKEKWQTGENLSIAVGQGYDSVTPLQNAVMIATIANGGKIVSPHVVSSVTDANDHVIYQWQGNDAKQVLSERTVSILKEGLKNVVESPAGTGHGLSALKLKIAGKTGTAQVVAREAWRGGIAEHKDHAWFVGYAPYDAPRIAMAVIVEHGGFGASAAAPVVGAVIKKYLNAISPPPGPSSATQPQPEADPPLAEADRQEGGR